jgi:hypothetical protein
MSNVFGRRATQAPANGAGQPFEVALRVSYDRYDVTSVGEPAYDLAALRAQVAATRGERPNRTRRFLFF